MLKTLIVVSAVACAPLALSPALLAAPPSKKLRHRPAAPAPSAAAPTSGGNLNSPATDFSTVTPVIEDPKAELLKPRKKKDPNFD